MREAIALHVDVNTLNEQIISKRTPHFNARSQMKSTESRHPVVAFSKRKCSRLSNGFHQRPWRFERVNSEGVMYVERRSTQQGIVWRKVGKISKLFVFAYGRMGYKARQCHFSH